MKKGACQETSAPSSRMPAESQPQSTTALPTVRLRSWSSALAWRLAMIHFRAWETGPSPGVT